MTLLSKIFASDYLIANPSIVAAMLAGLVATIVALLTFFGVLLSNRSSTNRAKADRQHSALQSATERDAMQERVVQEHQHAAAQAHKERLTVTRRQVYLEAMEIWSAALTNLMDLADKSPENLSNDSQFERLAACIAKISVVAEQDTVLAAQELHALFIQTFVNGASGLIEQGGIRGTLEVHEREYSKTQQSIDALLAAMKDFNLRGGANEGEFSRLQRAYEGEQQEAARHTLNAEKSREELLQVGNRFRMQQMDWAIMVSHKVVDFICALRRELDIATDPKALHEQAEHRNREARKTIETFMASIQATTNQ